MAIICKVWCFEF